MKDILFVIMSLLPADNAVNQETSFEPTNVVQKMMIENIGKIRKGGIRIGKIRKGGIRIGKKRKGGIRIDYSFDVENVGKKRKGGIRI